MRDDGIDRVLGGEEDVLPTSGFHAAVMEAIHREATAPPPIPFPWERAWPAIAAAALAFVLSPVLFAQWAAAGSSGFDALIAGADRVGASWVALAAIATTGSLILSRRLAAERY